MDQAAGIPGNVSGRITTSNAAVGIPYARVAIVNASDTSVLYGESTADIDGYYRFSGVNNTLHNGQVQTSYKIFASNWYDCEGYSESFGIGYDNPNVSCEISFPGSGFWIKEYGGTKYDTGRSIKQTGDNGFIIGGYSRSYGKGDQDPYLIRIDDNGTVLWNRTYGGSDEATVDTVICTTDGGYIAAGLNNLFKVDANGDVIWGKDISGCFIEKHDNYSYFVVDTCDILFISLIDTWGNKIWKNMYDLKFMCYESSVSKTNDGGLVIAGYEYNYTNQNFDSCLLKLDASGNPRFRMSYPTPDSESCEAVSQTRDGGYILTGHVNFVDKVNVCLIKTDQNGALLWRKSLNVDGYDYGSVVIETQDGGYIIGGETDPWGGAFLIKTDSCGETLWIKKFGEHRSGIYSVIENPDNNYIATGSTNRNAFLANIPEMIALYNRTINEGQLYCDTVWTNIEGYSKLKVNVSYGDGVPLSVETRTASFNVPAHQYGDNGNYTIKVTVTNVSDCYTCMANITVINVPPGNTTMDGTQIAYRNESFNRNMTFTDPGADSWRAYIDFGDGINASLETVNRTFSLPAHTYSRNGNYTVFTTITDDDGASCTKSFMITVTDRPFLDGFFSPPSIAGIAACGIIGILLGIVYLNRKRKR